MPQRGMATDTSSPLDEKRALEQYREVANGEHKLRCAEVGEHKKNGVGRQRMDAHWRSFLCSPRLANIRMFGEHKRALASRPNCDRRRREGHRHANTRRHRGGSPGPRVREHATHPCHTRAFGKGRILARSGLQTRAAALTYPCQTDGKGPRRTMARAHKQAPAAAASCPEAKANKHFCKRSCGVSAGGEAALQVVGSAGTNRHQSEAGPSP